MPQSPDWPEWMDDENYLASADVMGPGDPEVGDEDEDPGNAPPMGLDDAQLAGLIADGDEVAAGQEAAMAGRAARGQAGLVGRSVRIQALFRL